MNRADTRKANRLLRDPVVIDLIGEVSSNAFGGFVINAFRNRPEEIEEEAWPKLVELVLKAGKEAPRIAPEGFETKEWDEIPEEEKAGKKTPRKKAKKTDVREE